MHDCSLIINPNFPFLGASPDGKVCKDGVCGVIEVKCPFSAKGLNIQEAVSIFQKKTLFVCIMLMAFYY